MHILKQALNEVNLMEYELIQYKRKDIKLKTN